MSIRVRKIHRGQRGIGLLAILALVGIVAGLITGGNWFLNSTSVGQDIVNLFRGEDAPTPSEAPADLVESYSETWSCWDNDITSDLNSYRYVVWNCTETGQITSFGYRVGRSASGTKYTEGRVYLWDEVNNQRGALVGAGSHVPYMSLGYRNYGLGIPQPITYYYFDEDPVILYAGATYCIGIASAGGSGDLWFNLDLAGACCENVWGCYWVTQDLWHEDYNYGHSVTQMVLKTPTVTTYGHTLLDNGDIRLEGWAEVVGTMDCGFYYGTNETLVTAGNSTRVVSGRSAADDVRFSFYHDLAQIQSGSTYYYKAFSEIVGIEFTGAVNNFTWYTWQRPPSLACQLIQNDSNGLAFETSLVGSNGSISYNITLDFGTTYDLMLDQDGQATVVLNTTTDGWWRNSFAVNQTFDPDNSYWFRATAVGNDTSLVYSTPDWFLPWDSSRPSVINYIIEWTGLQANESWWLLALVIVVGAWVIAGILKWKWLGVIASAMVFVALVAYGVVPVWIVILAVLIAGWIIFKMVYNRAGATGSDH